jgi:hypothetical protein
MNGMEVRELRAFVVVEEGGVSAPSRRLLTAIRPAPPSVARQVGPEDAGDTGALLVSKTFPVVKTFPRYNVEKSSR